jgi:hypothetical protein
MRQAAYAVVGRGKRRGASRPGQLELAGRMGGDDPTKGKNLFPFYFLNKNSTKI